MAKILIVDDEVVYLRHLSMILEADGHEVDTAESGENALHIGQQSCPEILLTDWKLKEKVNGLGLARTLQAEHPELVIILMTGYSQMQVMDQALDLKALHILEKPFDADQIRNLIDEVANQKLRPK